MTIINSSGGGAPDEKPYFWESYEASGFGQDATGSGIRELQALARSQGLRITGTAAAKLQAGSLFQFYINGAISQSRQGQQTPEQNNFRGGGIIITGTLLLLNACWPCAKYQEASPAERT